jgi:hypothetical protein
MPNVPETRASGGLTLYPVEAPTAPTEGNYARAIGTASSWLYEYTSNSNAAEEFELTLVGGSGQIQGVEVPFPPYPLIQYYSAGSASEKIKYSESTLKITKVLFQPNELVIKPIVISFETHAQAPLKKGETLVIRVLG